MRRSILHVDANSFYASVECLYNPAIRDCPVAVCGDPEARHGIVLTKNQIAKQYGIRTGEAIWQARQRCPNLVVVQPNHALYVDFSRKMRALYEEYTDLVEPFGLDENWLDISAEDVDEARAEKIAHDIRRRVKEELGITVSVGASYNKVFAKLGSDYKKPDAVTAIWERNYQKIVWPLPVSDLIYVGPHTTRKLIDIGVLTIGQLANTDAELLAKRFGRNGIMLKAFAMGLDNARVMAANESEAIKSIGNSTTPPRDIETALDAKCLIYLLSETVAARLREHGFKTRVVSVSVRTAGLATFSCQRVLSAPTNLAREIADMALQLFMERYPSYLPLRSMGVACGQLTPEDAPVQIDLFGESERRCREEDLERAVDGLRRRFGHQVVRRGIIMLDRKYADINPKEDHTIHPIAFLRDETAPSKLRL